MLYWNDISVIQKERKEGERRFHESLDNLTPKDVYLGQGEKIKKIREIIKQNSINKRILIIKQGNIRVNNYICSYALSFDNVQKEVNIMQLPKDALELQMMTKSLLIIIQMRY